MRIWILLPLLVGCAGSPTRHVEDAGAIGPYSSAVVAGDFVFVAGKIGERGSSFEHEVETCIDAVERTLADLDLNLGDVVETRVYLLDMERYCDFNAIYAKRLPDPYPARTCVAVAGLPGGARVELQVAARRR